MACGTDTLRARLRGTSPATTPSSEQWWQMPDRVELKVSHEALAAAQEGMYRVVNSAAGTGTNLAPAQKSGRSILIAGPAITLTYQLPS